MCQDQGQPLHLAGTNLRAPLADISSQSLHTEKPLKNQDPWALKVVKILRGSFDTSLESFKACTNNNKNAQGSIEAK